MNHDLDFESKLSPRGAEGSEVKVPFIHTKGGKYSFKVAGVAWYDKQRSSKKFESTPTSDTNIKIDETILNR